MNSTALKTLRFLIVLVSMLTLNLGFALDNGSNSSPVRLSGHIPERAVSKAAFVNPLDSSATVPVTFVLPLRNQIELEQLIQAIYNPADKDNYGKYLTTEEFVQKFAPTEADYNKVIAYAKSLGLTITNTHPNRLLLNVSGSTKSIETAFNVKLNVYQQANQRTFYAPDNDPEVSADMAATIAGIVGLDNSAVWRTSIVRGLSSATPNSFPSGPNGGYTPNDIKLAYNLSGITANGAGQNVALFELATYSASDITGYTNFFGLPPAKLVNVLVDGGATIGIDGEVTLDIELILALAPQSQIYVYEGPNSAQGLLDTYNRIATDNIAKQVSTSWGIGEDQVGAQISQTENAIFQQMAAQGQTMYASSGDQGAYTEYPNMTPILLDPSSQPYVCGVGGTSLTVNATTGAYVSEVVWNRGLGMGAGGGGVSTLWALPSWQTGISTTYSKTNRNVPDVSLNSDQYKAYAIFFNGHWNLYGGTSCAAPLWAAFTALVNQQRSASQLGPLGFANPTFYSIGKSTPADYHDITMGNNLVYQAGPGYDNATGWGSFNGANLFSTLTFAAPKGPTVSITSPANGATVSGITTVTASASSSIGIAHVDFYLDGVLTATDTNAPYMMAINTASLTNGQHVFKAIAYDTSNNSAQSSVTLNVNNATATSIFINAGSGALVDPCTGVSWKADQYFTGGGTYINTTLPSCLGVYTSEHFGNIQYVIPVANGNYLVTLKFAEIYMQSAGQRVFSVNLNGQRVISNLDIFKTVGYAKPLDFTFPVTVTNNSVTIQLVGVVQNPKISAIAITPQ
ncbi:MAG TPA: protease pro-enzyme activation domain-containing protein [Rhabdochlamydiaceae bacterium]|nr:protease pro-enzyme activation domain-containing protein [Rhabdochlamydiaceae bacterium]